MKQNFMSRIFPLFLSICLLISNFSIPALAAAPDSLPEAPALSEPDPTEESAPEESVPETSIPEESAPEESIPEEAAPEESIPEEVLPEESLSPEPLLTVLPPEEPDPLGPGLYFGLLHAHTGLSDGIGTPAEAFAHAAQVEGLDFFAITDHSHSFDGQASGELDTDAAAVSQDWAAGKMAAADCTTRDFVGIWGYEMSWPANMQIGHIATFGTSGFQSWKQEPYQQYKTALNNYYQALAAVSGAIGLFNHPGSQYGTFSDFEYSPEGDRAMRLLDIGAGEDRGLSFYLQALDQGWHLAPVISPAAAAGDWGTGTAVRTVVDARELTAAGIYEAIRSLRVYATEDSDLEIHYTMDGFSMGSRLALRQVGQRADISIQISDPTDSAVGLVEVITTGETAVAQGNLTASFGTLQFSLPPESGYYFLRITQPDGDVAVTAPIWVDGEEELGIASLTCETAVPVQKEPVSLGLSLYNRENVDFLVESLTFFAGEEALAQPELDRIEAGASLTLPVSLSCDSVGLTRIRAVLTGTLEGSARTYETSLDLNFRRSQQVTSLLVDGSHGNAGLEDLALLRQMALTDSIDLTIAREEITADELENIRFLMIPAPSQPFSDGFLAAVAEYVQYGGNLILCGQGKPLDKDFSSAAELNRLFAAVGSTMKIRADLVQDSNHGSQPDLLYLENINRSSSVCQEVTENQVFRALSAASVDPGQGDWLVRGFSTTVSDAGVAEPVLLACETLAGGGTVFAAGSLFFADDSIRPALNTWDEPYANRTIAQALLGIGDSPIPLSTVAQARVGSRNELFRVQGYVTAGTSNPHNSFQDTIYIQDDTGGIAVTPVSGISIQQGTPVEITGFADQVDGNPVLKFSALTVQDRDMYQTQPLKGSWPELLNLQENSGMLVQVEGTCQEIYCREDNTMSGCLLKDGEGKEVRLLVESVIGNLSDGENRLQDSVCKGRTIRATGLLHRDAYGQTVIRVRNCEEVVYIPPRIGPYVNPRTGDSRVAVLALAISALGLFLLIPKKQRKNTAG